MTDTANQNGNADNQDANQATNQTTKQSDDGAPRLSILTQYVRDLSFENPGAPSFAASNPQIGVNANVGARKLSDTDFEVGLKFRLEAVVDDQIQFIAELDYCGVFRIENVPEAELKPVLLIEAPRQLFPFARRVLADATRDGGYPPVLLDPIDFVSLYQQGQQAEAEQAQADPNGSDGASA